MSYQMLLDQIECKLINFIMNLIALLDMKLTLMWPVIENSLPAAAVCDGSGSDDVCVRSRREDDQRRRDEEKMRSDLQHLLIVQRRYTMRQLHLRQLKTLEILPASTLTTVTLISVMIVSFVGSVTINSEW